MGAGRGSSGPADRDAAIVASETARSCGRGGRLGPSPATILDRRPRALFRKYKDINGLTYLFAAALLSRARSPNDK
jgi:hypothetical protein